jgi:hypothetical protein
MKYGEGDIERRTVMIPTIPLHGQFLLQRHQEPHRKWEQQSLLAG